VGPLRVLSLQISASNRTIGASTANIGNYSFYEERQAGYRIAKQWYRTGCFSCNPDGVAAFGVNKLKPPFSEIQDVLDSVIMS
jgi:hypothetical protein